MVGRGLEGQQLLLLHFFVASHSSSRRRAEQSSESTWPWQTSARNTLCLSTLSCPRLQTPRAQSQAGKRITAVVQSLPEAAASQRARSNSHYKLSQHPQRAVTASSVPRAPCQREQGLLQEQRSSLVLPLQNLQG